MGCSGVGEMAGRWTQWLSGISGDSSVITWYCQSKEVMLKLKTSQHLLSVCDRAVQSVLVPKALMCGPQMDILVSVTDCMWFPNPAVRVCGSFWNSFKLQQPLEQDIWEKSGVGEKKQVSDISDRFFFAIWATRGAKDKKRILKATREKQIFMYKETFIKLSTDFSAKTLQTRREWQEICKVMKSRKSTTKNTLPRNIITYNERKKREFYRKVKLKELISTKQDL